MKTKKVVRRGLHTYVYLLIIVTIIAVFGALTAIGGSATDDKESSFIEATYPYNGKTGVAIVGFNKTAFDKNGKVTIPAEFKGKPVLALGIDGSLECIDGADKIQGLDLTQAGQS